MKDLSRKERKQLPRSAENKRKDFRWSLVAVAIIGSVAAASYFSFMIMK